MIVRIVEVSEITQPIEWTLRAGRPDPLAGFCPRLMATGKADLFR